MIPTPTIPTLKLPRTVRGRARTSRVRKPDVSQPTSLDQIPDVEVSLKLASARGSGKRTSPQAPSVATPTSIVGVPDVQPEAPRLARNLRAGRVRPARVRAPSVPTLSDLPDL